jgi:hypothetical protein
VEVTDPVLGRITVMQPVTRDERLLIEIARITEGGSSAPATARRPASAPKSALQRAPIRALVIAHRELARFRWRWRRYPVLHGWSNATWAFRVP